MNTYKNFLNSIQLKDALISYNENLKKYCSFKIGGKAKFFIIVNNENALLKILKWNKYKRFFVLGAGTNILFKDRTFNGTIIKLGGKFNQIKILSFKKNYKMIEVGAGVNLFRLNSFLKSNELAGLEWSFGIPGSVGGATKMNAGAYGFEFGNFIYSVKILSNNKISWTKNFYFSYRNSSFNNCIILAVKLKLPVGNFLEIENLQREYLKKRIESQPYEEYSAGSVFKRIINKEEIIYPAKIIDNLGLKGAKIGDAEISTKHAGFIINKDNAKCKDVLKLIKLIQRKVKKNTGKQLETEIIIV